MKLLNVAIILWISIILICACGTDDNSALIDEVFFSQEQSSSNLPSVSTNTEVYNIIGSTAESGGKVSSQGSSEVIARGVCYNTKANPTINDYYTVDGAGTGSFKSELLGLQSNTTYFVRAYATNSSGTAYGQEVSFKSSIYSSTIPTNGLIAYYPFNGTAADESGNGLDGIPHNIYKITDRFGNEEASAYFSGESDNWIEVPHNNLLNLGPNFTISVWIYKEEGSSHYVLGKGRDIACGSWHITTPGVSIDGPCGIGASGSTELDYNRWYFIVAVLNSASGKLCYYQDGQLISEVNAGTFIGNTDYPFAIGRHITSPSSLGSWPYPFKGKIDDIRIYNRVLTQTEISQIYNASN